MKDVEFCIVQTTTDNEKITHKIITAILEKHLGACIQVQEIKSHYRWEEEIEESSEFLLQIKTQKRYFELIKDEIKSLHSYDVPEIILIPIMDGSVEYLQWLKYETKQ